MFGDVDWSDTIGNKIVTILFTLPEFNGISCMSRLQGVIMQHKTYCCSSSGIKSITLLMQ